MELKYQYVTSSLTSDVIWFGYNNPANRAAVKFIVDSLHKAEREGGYPFIVHVIGGVEDMGCVTQSGCQYYGALSEEELVSRLERVRWVIAPIFSSAGVSTKIIKALSHGVPVLTTQFGVKYFSVSIERGGPIVVAEKGMFFDVLLGLYTDLQGTKNRRQKIPGFAEKTFSMHLMREDLRGILDAAHSVASTRRRQPVAKLQRSIIWELDENFVDLSFAKKFINAFEDTAMSFRVLPVQHCRHREMNIYVTVTGFSRPECCPKDSCQLVFCQSLMKRYSETLMLSDLSGIDQVWFPSTSAAMDFRRHFNFNRKLTAIIPIGLSPPAECKYLESALWRSEDKDVTTSKLARQNLRSQYAIFDTEIVYLYLYDHTCRVSVDQVVDSWCASFPWEGPQTPILIVNVDMTDFEVYERMLHRNANRGPIRCARVIISLADNDSYDEILGAADVLIYFTEKYLLFTRSLLSAFARGIPIIMFHEHPFRDYLSRKRDIMSLSADLHIEDLDGQGQRFGKQLELSLKDLFDNFVRHRFTAGFDAILVCHQLEFAKIANAARLQLELSHATSGAPVAATSWTTLGYEKPVLFRNIVESEGDIHEKCFSCSI